MGSAETIRRSAKRAGWGARGLTGAVILSLLAAAVGCRARLRPPKKNPRPASPARFDAGVELEVRPSASSPLPAPIAQALAEVHDGKVELAGPSDGITRLAFGKGRLAQAMDTKVVFRDLKDGSIAAEVDLGDVQAVSESPNGSLFALGIAGGTWFEPQNSKPRGFPRVAFFRGASLFPDLEESNSFYVYYEAQAELFHYSVESEAGAFLPIEDRFPLADCVTMPNLTRDGAFLCSTVNGIARRAPRGRETRFNLRPGLKPAARLLPAKRLDELYSVSASGLVARVRLEPGLPEQARFQLPGPVFAAQANGEVLAFVLVTPPLPGRSRRFTLLVTDLDGRERLKVELPSKRAEASDDWLRAMIGDKNLALSRFDSLVAVGGSDAVSVWDYARGQLVFSR